MPELLQLFLLSLLGSVIALVGGVVFLASRSWSGFLERHSVPFAAGVLLTVAFVGLMPEAHEIIGERSFMVVLVTFLSVFVFEHLLFGIHHHEDEMHGNDYSASVPLVIVGDTIHNLIDGIAIAAAFFVSPGLGLITAVSTFLHEVPHEIGDFGILLRAGWSRGRVLVVNAISASMAIVGAFAMLWVRENTALVGSLLAVAAGIYIYLGASDFLPRIEEEYKNRVISIIPMTVGIVLMLVALSIAHPHP